jgi:hypothetical protein
MNYKGKGEHSVNELELIIEQREEELHLLKSGQKQLILSDVVKSLPTKEDVVSEWYRKVKEGDVEFRKVFKDIVDDAYYSGALDMHEELT